MMVLESAPYLLLRSGLIYELLWGTDLGLLIASVGPANETPRNLHRVRVRVECLAQSLPQGFGNTKPSFNERYRIEL